MSWILMEPARDKESLAAVTTLRESGKNLFDLSPSGPRLLPLSFGSRACSHSEQHWHSFVGEAGTGSWAMCQNKKFLWGLVHPFYWMCDCLAMKEIFEYNGSISQIARWAQEMLGYNFVIVHRPCKMMIDVDALNRFHDKRIALYLAFTGYLKLHDREARPAAYDSSVFASLRKTTVVAPKAPLPVIHTSALPDSCIFDKYRDLYAKADLQSTSTPAFTLSSHPVTSSAFTSLQPSIASEKSTSLHKVAIATPHIHITCIKDTLDSFPSLWSNIFSTPSVIQRLFTSSSAFSAFSANFKYTAHILPSSPTTDALATYLIDTNAIFAAYLPNNNLNAPSWILLVLQSAINVIRESSNLQFILLWCPSSFLSEEICNGINEFANKSFPSLEWTYSCRRMNAANSGSKQSLVQLHTLFCPHDDPTFQPTIQDPSIFILAPSASAPHLAILDPCGIGTEPNPTLNSHLQPSSQFSIPFRHSNMLYCIWTISNTELLSYYRFQSDFTISDSTLDELLPFSMPPSLASVLLQQIDSTQSFLDILPFAPSDICDSSPCYTNHSAPSPISSTLIWTEAYTNDLSTNTIILGLSNHDNNKWSTAELNNIDKFYHQKLHDGEIDLFQGKLIHNKCIFLKTKYIALIIVPMSLRQRIFDCYHSGPLGAHMGEYKTLSRIRLRFTWPQLQTDIKSMLQTCAHCQAYNCTLGLSLHHSILCTVISGVWVNYLLHLQRISTSPTACATYLPLSYQALLLTLQPPPLHTFSLRKFYLPSVLVLSLLLTPIALFAVHLKLCVRF
ncbi:hypothetical protein CTEN210_06929 [Chaetoceros tenuissimus]|uniref:Integrase zinc-binding domain-containing protein n=1 Tax=Chaetoceros tenuissimus TaxID=426638 RepID=A0AAD3CQT8_9STRA|nr:hypothetical protein CTEN210_06929 [Chaetoceros tenuissimus]